MVATNEKQPDQGRIVASLASECHVPVGEMAALYEHERAELAAGARITKYLHIFATRKVLELLRRPEGDGTRHTANAEPATPPQQLDHPVASEPLCRGQGQR